MGSEKMSALPSFLYGDPALCMDEVRRLRAAAERKQDRERMNKSKRIQALVRQAMKGVKR